MLSHSLSAQLCDQLEYDVYFDSQETTVPAAIQTGEVECYRITPNQNWSFGSIWSDTYVDLSNSFEYSYYVYLGTNDAGADGLVFVLNGDPLGPAASGAPGGELGYAGMGNTQGISPSIGIEFDTWDNGAGFGDIWADHVTLNVDGFMNTNPADAFPLPNIEDGEYHLVELVWDAVQMNLKVNFDGLQVINENIDLVNDVFDGDPNVLVGFIGSTGGANNEQIICDIQVIYTEVCNGIDDDCDGLIDEDLDTEAEVDAQICDGNTYQVAGSTYNQTGVYTDVIANASGCDSTIQTTLSVLDLWTVENDVSICQGQSYTEGTSTYTIAGTYTDMYIDANGCDSSVVTMLEVNELSNSVDEVTICEGETHQQGASQYTISGTYFDVYSNIFNCDSVIETQLEVLNVDTTSIFIQFCPGASFTTPQATYTDAGLVDEWYTSANGCDSLVSITIDVFAESSSFQERIICSGGQVAVGNSIYTEAGQYTDTLTAINSCDSTVTTVVTVMDELVIADTVLCDGQSFEIDLASFPQHQVTGADWVSGSTYGFNSAGNYTVTVDLDGCQLEANFSVQVRPTFQTRFIELAACRDESVDIMPREIGIQHFWEDDSQDSLLTVYQPGLYIIDYPYICGDFQDRYIVSFPACQCDVFIPNSFTPNGDGQNDYFKIEQDCEFLDFNLSIYSRDGELMFETIDPQDKWDGGIGEYHVPVGVYNWRLWYRTSAGDVLKTGRVNKIR